jgi:sialate O-acetylesterase
MKNSKINCTFSGYKILLFLIALLSANSLTAKVKLPQIFSNNMVFQRDKPIPVWGWANPDEEVKVDFLGNSYSVKANSNGKWKLTMKAVPFGGPYILKVNDITLDNILVGDVFLCSGQSNMAFLLQNSDDATEAIVGSENSNIRLYTVPRDIEFYPLDDVDKKTTWELCNPTTVKKFSAVAYYMARKLQKDLNIPIGLVHSSYGGTVIEGFISAKPLDTIARLKPILTQIGNQNKEQFIASRVAELEKIHGKINQNLNNGILWDTISPVVPEYTSSWATMKLPTLWEKAGLPNVDGVIWFYKEINLKQEDCQQDAFLSLGRIADQSVTFFNGTKLGSSIDSRDLIRDYTIPKNLLKPGINKIMVRVANKGRNGGIWGPQSRLYFKTGSKKTMIDGDWRYKIQDIDISVHPNDVPSSIYNAMINPLKNLQYKGVIWYQGESSANWANEYEGLLKMMIKDWRSQFKQPELPFMIIQLPNYKAVATQPEVNSTWALLREAQANTTKLPNVGLVNIIDLGLADNIHPTNKIPVGERTALKVEQMIYRQNVVADGPKFEEISVSGGKATLTFGNSKGLHFNKDGNRTGFMIAGKDQKFVWADAEISDGKVIVWNKNVLNPVAVRYAWADNSGERYLYNTENLPMQPFRTDIWPITLDEIPR